MLTEAPKILLVEDAPEIRLLLSSGLKKAGYQVIQSKNGQEGVEAWQSQQPDLVLMDVSMPIMDGFEACKLIREQDVALATPVLMLTGSDDIHSINRAFEVGASDFITKPVNLPLLVQRIRYALRDAEREKELRHARNLQDSARALAGIAFWEYDPGGDQLNWMDDAERLLHWLKPLPSNLEKALTVVHTEDHPRLKSAFMAAINHGAPFDLELRTLAQGQSWLVKMVGQRDEDSNHIIGAVQDITALRSLEQQAEYLSQHDAITGLPNRKLFIRSLDEQLVKIQGQQDYLVVVVLHLNQFHQISDALGSDAADQLIILLANQLQNQTAKQGQAARLEGGTLAFWLTTQTPPDSLALEQELRALLQPLLRQWFIEEHDLLLNFTAGISYGPQQAKKAVDLLRFAQRALREPVSEGQQLTLSVYQPGEIDLVTQRLSLESDLRRAVEREEFTLAYQPQLDLATNQIVGVESLLRWNHPEKGPLSPAVFIPLLEEMGLIQTLGDWIIYEACRQQKQWEMDGLALRMGINLSPAQFSQSDLVEKITAAASATGAAPAHIKLEITESLAMRDPSASIKMLDVLRERGFKIAIDDFGIGFSSLEYLLKFPLDTLKIDRAFVKDITRGRSDRAIIRALTSLCQSLDISTIAEGVEDQRQKDYVDALGATEIQGYLISKPLASHDLVAFVTRYKSEQAQR